MQKLKFTGVMILVSIAILIGCIFIEKETTAFSIVMIVAIYWFGYIIGHFDSRKHIRNSSDETV